jgi:hypothetical protein
MKSIAILAVLGGLVAAPSAQASTRPSQVIKEIDAYYAKTRAWPLDTGTLGTVGTPADVPTGETVWAHKISVRWTCDPASHYHPAFQYLVDKPKSLTYMFCFRPPNGNPQKVVDPRSVFGGVNPYMQYPADLRPVLKKIGRQAANWTHTHPSGHVVYVHATATEVDVRYSSGRVLRLH